MTPQGLGWSLWHESRAAKPLLAARALGRLPYGIRSEGPFALSAAWPPGTIGARERGSAGLAVQNSTERLHR